MAEYADSTPPESLIGERVRALRAQRGWTQDEFARRLRDKGFLSWTRAVVASLEYGGRKLDVAELVGFALVFGVPIADLCTGTQDWVRLADGIDIKREGLAKLLAGGSPADLMAKDLRGIGLQSSEKEEPLKALLKTVKAGSTISLAQITATHAST